jgi:transcriptional regulator with XRE-family HTH domain
MEGPPNHPKTFGEELQRLRESAGLSLEDIAKETKISRQILSCLESGDFRFLPQKVFSRNFVNQYANVVGADPHRVGEAFEAAWDRFLLASGAHPRLLLIEEAPFIRSFRWRFWIPVCITAGILVVAAVVIMRSSSTSRSPLVVDPKPSPTVQAPVAAIPRNPVVNPTPSLIPAGPKIQPEARELTIIVRVRPDRECWIHYRDGDGLAGGKLLAGGSEERIVLAGPVKLTVGDAAAVILEVGGEIYEDLGRPGQVVHTEVSSTGLTVLGSVTRDE